MSTKDGFLFITSTSFAWSRPGSSRTLAWPITGAPEGFAWSSGPTACGRCFQSTPGRFGSNRSNQLEGEWRSTFQLRPLAWSISLRTVSCKLPVMAFVAQATPRRVLCYATARLLRDEAESMVPNIDPEQVRKLAGWGLTQNDIASFVGWSQSLISLGF